MDLYSIIIPTHNRLDLLQECVRSVMAQSYPHWECIIVNDGSTDGTEQWLSTLDDPKVKYKTVPHRERSNARNVGFLLSNGDFVHFIDDDDTLSPSYLSDFVQARSDQQKEVMIRCGMEMFWADGQRRQTPNYNSKKYEHPIQFLTEEMCGTGCLSIPRTALEKNSFDLRWPHWQDTHLFLRLAVEYGLVQIPAYNYFYRQHDGMGTRLIFGNSDYTDKRLTLTLAAMRDIKDNYPPINHFVKENEWRRIIANKYLNFALETANLGKRTAWKYLWSSLQSAILMDKVFYYLRIPYFIIRSRF